MEDCFLWIPYAFCWHFIEQGDYDSVTLIFRNITSLFFVLAMIKLYQIFRVYFNKVNSTLIVISCALMPISLRMGTWFHPDMPMTFFGLCAIHAFIKDDFKFKRYFWIASLYGNGNVI